MKCGLKKAQNLLYVKKKARKKKSNKFVQYNFIPVSIYFWLTYTHIKKADMIFTKFLSDYLWEVELIGKAVILISYFIDEIMSELCILCFSIFLNTKRKERKREENQWDLI